jgi:putative ABC transport system permease protein
MFQNYFKTGIRNILRERYYSLIKIAGLALGLGTSLVLFLYVTHQLSYDSFHPDVDRLYRINQTNIWNPAGGKFNSTGPAVAFSLLQEYPEIEEVLRINTPGENTIRYTKADGDVLAFNESKILAADSNFFSFFAFHLKEGDPGTALQGKNKVVLSDKAAAKLFGNESALGKFILWGDERIVLEVTGITTPQPTNTHFNFDYLISMYSNPSIKEFEWSWIWTQVVTYVKLKPQTDVATLARKLKNAPDQYAPNTFKRLGMDYKEFVKERGAWELFIQPVRDIHLYSTDMGENRLGITGDIQNVYIFSLVGIFILLIAVVNFINLSTARGIKRAKEVGVKKTLGMDRKSLILQFQIEHITIAAFSMLLGLGVMELLRMLIQPLTGLEIPLVHWSNSTFMLVIFAAPIVVGFLAGLYPSFYLTSFQPAKVLKGKLMGGNDTSHLRHTLVVFQFTISIALIAATLIVFQQLKFFQSQNLGFDHENILLINHAEKLGDQAESFRDEILEMPVVKDASLGSNIRGGYEDIFMREGDNMKLPITAFKIDEHFFSTTKLSLSTGRSFEEGRPSDKNTVIINETTARLFGWTPEEALSKYILYLGDDLPPLEVIGVVKDFHFQSLRQSITPLLFLHISSHYPDLSRMVAIKFQTKEVSKLINQIEQRWNQRANAAPFDFSFFEEDVKRQYQQEQRLGALFSIFTGLSITIAIIGLVGLVSYSAEQRKKEIGIRKTFGASLSSIYLMMNSQYIKLILIALVLATPTTWWLMQKWLESFAYKISINPLIFALAGIAELLLALVCVGYLALRAASLNPATVLKEE